MPAHKELKNLCAEPSGSGCDDFAREKLPPLRRINRLPLCTVAKRAIFFLAAPGWSPAGAYGCLQLLQVETIRSERYQKSAPSVTKNPLRASQPMRHRPSTLLYVRDGLFVLPVTMQYPCIVRCSSACR